MTQFGISDRAPKGTYSFVDLVDLQTPKNGYVCMLDMYWLTTDGKALFYGTSPQCNSDERVISHVLTTNAYLLGQFTDLQCTKIPIAYIRQTK